MDYDGVTYKTILLLCLNQFFIYLKDKLVKKIRRLKRWFFYVWSRGESSSLSLVINYYKKLFNNLPFLIRRLDLEATRIFVAHPARWLRWKDSYLVKKESGLYWFREWCLIDYVVRSIKSVGLNIFFIKLYDKFYFIEDTKKIM